MSQCMRCGAILEITTSGQQLCLTCQQGGLAIGKMDYVTEQQRISQIESRKQQEKAVNPCKEMVQAGEQQRRRELFEKVAIAYLKPTGVRLEDGINYYLDLAAKHTEAILQAAGKFAKGEKTHE